MTIGIIAALNSERIIGAGGELPWHYRADLARFKRVTLGSSIVMGRLTWQSLPKKPLPGRVNIVITSKPQCIEAHDNVRCYGSILEAATVIGDGDLWFIGGARIFEEALGIADTIDLTWVPDRITRDDVVHFPELDLAVWQAGPREPHPDDDRLEHQVFRRRRHAG